MALADGTTLGLALSGGGFRATLFGLGSLWRLNDAGLLGRLDRVTSVSGGSIMAGILASRWHALDFKDGRARNFREEVVQTVQQFCALTADVEAGLLGWITPFRSAADYLCRHYRDELFGDLRMHDLPPRQTNVAPLFVFYATNLQTGRSFRFRQDMLADYRLGVNRVANPLLAMAVTASSAFPPIFSPVTVETDPGDWRDEDWELGSELLHDLRREIVLSDGGIYDNMGLESLNEQIQLVSDAGAPFAVEAGVRSDYFSQLTRIRDIFIDQGRALRKRQLVEEFAQGRRRGAYWGIGTQIADYGASGVLSDDNAMTRGLQTVPTRLASTEAATQGVLINWAYALADAALRTRARLPLEPAKGWPLPEFAPH